MAIQIFYIVCVIYTLTSFVLFLSAGILGFIAIKKNKGQHEEIIKKITSSKEAPKINQNRFKANLVPTIMLVEECS